MKPLNLNEIKNYPVEIDLGTGDGRFIYKNALKNPGTLYIGIDPSHKQLEIYKKKANRKRLTNALFLVASAEKLPNELKNTADTLNIILPWGSLLQAVAAPNPEVLENITNLLKPKGILKIIFGYAKNAEPTETERLALNNISLPYIKNTLLPQYEKTGLKPRKIHKIAKKELKNFESTWCKKLAFGKERPLFYLEFQLQE